MNVMLADKLSGFCPSDKKSAQKGFPALIDSAFAMNLINLY